MALESRTRGEGILIRLGLGPIITGAHYETITEFVNDGVVVGGQANPLQSLDLAEELPALLGEVAAGALIQIEQSNQQIAALEQYNQQIIEQANAALAELQAKADTSAAQADALAQSNKSLSEQLQAALAEIERLTAPQAVEPAPEPEQA